MNEEFEKEIEENLKLMMGEKVYVETDHKDCLSTDDCQVDHWERLSNSEANKVREMTSNSWTDITVEVPPFKQPTGFAGAIVKDARIPSYKWRNKFGTIVIKYTMNGKRSQTSINADAAGYKYRSQKNKPWEQQNVYQEAT